MSKISVFHDYFCEVGGAELVLKVLVTHYTFKKTFSKGRVVKIKTLFATKDINYRFQRLVNVQPIFAGKLGNWLCKMFKKNVGKLLTPFLNLIFDRKIKLHEVSFINTSFYLPLSNKSKKIIYYHKFPTWFLSNPSTYLKNMPFVFKWFFSLFMLIFHKQIFNAFSSPQNIVISNSSKTAYLFYKYWQKHSEIFLPILGLQGIYNKDLYSDNNIRSKKTRIAKIYNHIKVAYIGRMEKGKNLECVKKVILKLKKNAIDNISFGFIGKGSLLKDIKKTKYINLRFYGWVPRQKVFNLLKFYDFVLSLGDEAFGLTSFEALLFKKAVIGYAYTGLYDFGMLQTNVIPIYNLRKCSNLLYNKLLQANKLRLNTKDNIYIEKILKLYNIKQFVSKLKFYIS